MYILRNGWYIFKPFSKIYYLTLFCTLPYHQNVSKTAPYNATFSLKVDEYAIFKGVTFLLRVDSQCPLCLIMYSDERTTLFRTSNTIQAHRQKI